MSKLVNYIVKRYLNLRNRNLSKALEEPALSQHLWLRRIIDAGHQAEYARKQGLKAQMDYAAFSTCMPITEYVDIANDIDRMMMGEQDILWPGTIDWYAKSSGTTNSKSKFIPVSKAFLKEGHIESAWDTMTLLYSKIPDAQMFAEKSLLVGGTLSKYDKRSATIYGDISAILIDQMPAVGRPFYTPDFETALIDNWDEKLEKIAQISCRENVVMIGGVPTWNIVLFRRILEITGKSNLKEVWPNLQAYVHGGVSFEPYRELFQHLIPDENMVYQEIYNASEGFFAIQDRKEEPGMALLVDNAIFYEFVPAKDWNSEHRQAVPLNEVQLGVNYVMLVTNNAGLWRYAPGDTVEFITLNPHRIKITGRVRHFINAFGEEVMVGNTDRALATACAATGALAGEYTVAPIYFDQEGKGGHEWMIEFDKTPPSIEEFITILDNSLMEVNSDYEAKRYQNMALLPPKLNVLQNGSFESWLRSTRTMGAQVKVPRLSNDRKVIDSIHQFLKKA